MPVSLPTTTVFAALVAGLLTAGEPIKERSVTFDIIPIFKIEGSHTEHSYASFEIDGRHLIWPETAPKHQSLQDGKKYRFEIIETRTAFPDGAGIREIWDPELHRVSIGTTVIYDASLCSAHKVPMKRTEVSVIFGMPSGSEAYWKAFRAQFPNCGLVYGGCIVMPERQISKCWLCDECKTAKKNWKEPSR